MNDFRDQVSASWLPRPLCCKYLLAMLVDVSVTVIEVGHIREHLVRWGLGVLPDGEHEFLGVWSEPDSKRTVWQTIASDLKSRGVESIRFVVGTDPVGIESAMRLSFPGITVLPAVGDFLHQKERGVLTVLNQLGQTNGLAPRHRRIFHKAGDAADQLNRRLKRAVVRHGCFPNLVAATSFVDATISRAECDPGALRGDTTAGPAPIATKGIGRAGRLGTLSLRTHWASSS